MSDNGVEKQFDTYIKKTIKNAILDVKKYETRKEYREVSFETLISEKDISVPFLFHINANKIEDYIENEKFYQIISNLKLMQKKVLKLKIVYQYTSE